MLRKGVIFFACVSLLFLTVSCNNEDPVSSDSNPGDNGGDNGGDDTFDSTHVTDIDGNVYNAVRIGNQVWTTEDLRTTRFNDGSAIPYVTDQTEWITLTTPAFCYYKNSEDTDTIQKYGALYNWYAVSNALLAPEGWHVPSIAEWDTLFQYLIAHGYNWDGTQDGNKIAKAIAAQSVWRSSEVPGSIGNDLSRNNSSHFNALPSGCRFQSGVFGFRGVENHWWSTTGTYANHAFSIYLLNERVSVATHAHYRHEGFSVRLIKDN